MPVQISGLTFLHQDKEKSSYQYMSANIFRGTVEKCIYLDPVEFYLWGHLKTLVYSAPTENEDTLYQCIFMHVKL
jgi:hypothetical protein